MNASAAPLFEDAWPEYQVTSSSVFHYTSAAGLLGMIEQGQLWASEAGGLNDHAEITAGRNFLREAWRVRPQEIAAAVGDESATLLEQMITGMGSDWWSTGPEGVFVLCASTAADDANQWRLYADHGRGFSIELDAQVNYELVPVQSRPRTPRLQALKAMSGAIPVSPWRSVLYEDARRNEALSLVLARIRENSAQFDSSLSDALQLLATSSSGGRALDALCQLIKAPGFAGENEARIVIAFRTSSLSEDFVHFRAAGTGIVRTVYLHQMDSPQSEPNGTGKPMLPIKRIILGPAQRYDLSAPAIKALLARHGYKDVEVVPSEVSLR